MPVAISAPWIAIAKRFISSRITTRRCSRWQCGCRKTEIPRGREHSKHELNAPKATWPIRILQFAGVDTHERIPIYGWLQGSERNDPCPLPIGWGEGEDG